MKAIDYELNHLESLLKSGNESEYKKEYLRIQDEYTSPEDKEKIADFIMNSYTDLGTELQDVDKAITIQEQLEPIKEIVSLSYIAKNYFGKSAAWLQQRIYGYKVRGKIYRLSHKDIDILNNALQDISKKIGNIVITD